MTKKEKAIRRGVLYLVIFLLVFWGGVAACFTKVWAYEQGPVQEIPLFIINEQSRDYLTGDDVTWFESAQDLDCVPSRDCHQRLQVCLEQCEGLDSEAQCRYYCTADFNACKDKCKQ